MSVGLKEGRRPVAAAPSDQPVWRQVIARAAERHAEETRSLKQNRSRQRSEDILDAALRVFSRVGVARARISDIAAEAGIPASSFYDYYANKEDLAYAIPIRRQIQFFAEYASSSAALSSVDEQLRHFLWLTTDFARRNPDWASVLYLEIWPSVLIKDANVRGVVDDYARIIVGLIGEGARRGEWPDDANPYETATIFIGAVSQLIITWLLYRKPRDLTRSARPMVDRLMTLLAVTPAAGGSAVARQRGPRKAGPTRPPAWSQAE